MVVLVKDDPKEELWYGEIDGADKEGYFPRDCVTLMPRAVSPSMQLSGADLEILTECSQRLKVISWHFVVFALKVAIVWAW